MPLTASFRHRVLTRFMMNGRWCVFCSRSSPLFALRDYTALCRSVQSTKLLLCSRQPQPTRVLSEIQRIQAAGREICFQKRLLTNPLANYADASENAESLLADAWSVCSGRAWPARCEMMMPETPKPIHHHGAFRPMQTYLCCQNRVSFSSGRDAYRGKYAFNA